ncbi:Chromate resistance protein ChrB [uncultured Nocardioides sp.]|uniref:Chromate resistance protein ChrB n=1 Tax=uncultured Nocardioides sp. TaxID=198441 RepID=UPI00262399AA|nr:Chromate resistance protein ChrB [uncultured Nocardioides sp.]
MVTSSARAEPVPWVCLLYRVPREPSTPRIAVWRKLRALGVAQLGDGAVALPEDPRTREHLEWVADRVLEADGSALLLRAQTLTRADEERIVRGMAAARAEEYRDLAREALSLGPADLDPRVVRRLRRTLRAIQRRDYFPPPERDDAAAAVRALKPRATGSARVGAPR